MDPLLAGEQALLGAILLDPHQLRHLTWLEPCDLHRPAHQAVFSALRDLRHVGHPGFDAVSEVPLDWLTDTLALAGEKARGLNASYLHTLIAACPRPGNAPLYGRIVLEGSIRRTVTEHAVRLLAIAEEDLAQGNIDGTAAQADVLVCVLADLARRWGTPPRAQRPASTPDAAPAAEPSDAGQADEQFLLSLLVHQDGAVGEVFDWLRPADFAVPGHGPVYRCLGALHHRGEPIDSVTARWEVHRRGLLTDGTLTNGQLAPILDAHLIAGSAEWSGERLLRASLARTAGDSARRIAALADEDRLVPGQLIGQALHALGPLDEVRARWNRAVRPPQQPKRNADRDAQAAAALTRSSTPASSPSTAPPRRKVAFDPPPCGNQVAAGPNLPARSLP